MFFPKEFVEENEFLDALMVTLELSDFQCIQRDARDYTEIIIFKGEHKFDSNFTIIITLSKKTGMLLAGKQQTVLVGRYGASSRQVVDKLYTYDSMSNIEVLEGVMKWL